MSKKSLLEEPQLKELLDLLKQLNIKNMYENDFFLTWDKTEDELKAIWLVADILRYLRTHNISSKIFTSGLAISIFRDNSTRTRFSFVSACNLLGLVVQDLDEKKSQIAHGETVRETANMVSFMADVIGIRDDMYIGKGHTYQKEVVNAVTQGFIVGGVQNIAQLKGKKIAMTWAYSPSYGKPLSVPQGVIGLLTRFGMNVVLAHPEGYEVMDDVLKIAKENSEKSGGKFTVTHDMKEAFKDADIVYPKSWAPFKAMETRTDLYGKGDFKGIDELEKKLLKQNAEHKDWTCDEEMMKLTKDGKGLYLHCLPADITGVSCKEGEVISTVFDRFRDDLYKEASYKPYVIAAMIYLAKIKDPIKGFEKMINDNIERKTDL